MMGEMLAVTGEMLDCFAALAMTGEGLAMTSEWFATTIRVFINGQSMQSFLYVSARYEAVQCSRGLLLRCARNDG
jgi:hypothetical protein